MLTRSKVMAASEAAGELSNGVARVRDSSHSTATTESTDPMPYCAESAIKYKSRNHLVLTINLINIVGRVTFSFVTEYR